MFNTLYPFSGNRKPISPKWFAFLDGCGIQQQPVSSVQIFCAMFYVHFTEYGLKMASKKGSPKRDTAHYPLSLPAVADSSFDKNVG